MTVVKRKTAAIETGELYAYIWDQFDQYAWERFSDDHFIKWSPLPVGNDFLKDKVCLDAGCGSGRAVRSMVLSGARRVYGIDTGSGCIRNAIERNKEFSDKVEVKLASVVEIPYPKDFFDFVYCDGVLHHTTDPEKGFAELVRVLKPGGTIVIAVYGRGGLMNFAIYSSRIFRYIVPRRLTFTLCKLFSKNPVTWYAIMDCMYVPIRKNYYEREIHKWFEGEFLLDIKRLDSGWGPYAYGRWMRGEGYIKFMGQKALK